jgi:hypothetical protein
MKFRTPIAPSVRRFRVTKGSEGPYIVEADKFTIATLTTMNSVSIIARFYRGDDLVAYVNHPATITDVTA